MSRLDFCQYELVNDCYDWKNDNCDECNIFKAYCEGARKAKNSIVRCKDCKWWSGSVNTSHNNHLCKRALDQNVEYWTRYDDYCSYGERKGGEKE